MSLILFLIYLGGMLVVFAYSVALAADPYPETWGNWSVGVYVVGYFVLIVMLGVLLGGGGIFDEFGVLSVDNAGFGTVRADFSGVSLMYCWGGGYLLVSG